MISFTLNLAGQSWEVEIAEEELETVHLPLLKDIVQKATAKTGRYIVFIAGPPGSGKTTLGALWEKLAREIKLKIPIQTLPMDGFHFPNIKLDARKILRNREFIPLRKIKGAPESYNLIILFKSLWDLSSGKKLSWPRYDRQIHDPVPNAISVLPEGIIFVEGNYLLLDEVGWRELKPMADLTIFVECEETFIKEDILTRAQRGGRTYESAVQHYEFNDHPNWVRVMQRRLASDVVLGVNDGRNLMRVIMN